MKSIDPQALPTRELHGYLLGAVGPRPIAFASTIDTEGRPNLSPFSFFNVFSANPPTLIFSPARRVRDNTTKHTLENALRVDETVINIVNYDIVEQASLASTEYEEGVNEFTKAGLTELPSERVKPPRVKESPVQLECKIKEVIHLGEHGGAGNLVVCEVVLMHIDERILDENGKISPHKIDLVGRMGGAWYCRANETALFEVAKPSGQGIGIDALPDSIRNSDILTGNDLAQLANRDALPSLEDLTHVNESVKPGDHEQARQFLLEGKVDAAWKALLT